MSLCPNVSHMERLALQGQRVQAEMKSGLKKSCLIIKFNEAVRSADYIDLNGKTISE